MEFFDIKKESPTSTLIEFWVNKAGIDLVFNSRGTKYRSLKLKELNLDEKGKIQWLIKEPMLLKRPIIQSNENVIVGWKEEEYKKHFNT